MSEDFNNQLFNKVCELEAKLELSSHRVDELERIVKEAIVIVSQQGLTDYNTGWYLRAKQETRA